MDIKGLEASQAYAQALARKGAEGAEGAGGPASLCEGAAVGEGRERSLARPEALAGIEATGRTFIGQPRWVSVPALGGRQRVWSRLALRLHGRLRCCRGACSPLRVARTPSRGRRKARAEAFGGPRAYVAWARLGGRSNGERAVLLGASACWPVLATPGRVARKASDRRHGLDDLPVARQAVQFSHGAS